MSDNEKWLDFFVNDPNCKHEQDVYHNCPLCTIETLVNNIAKLKGNLKKLEEKLATAEEWDILESQRNEQLQARIDELSEVLTNEGLKTRRELQARIAELEGWIKIAGGIKCPNCNDEGFNPVDDGYGGWQQEQCEFCYTCPDSMFNVARAEE